MKVGIIGAGGIIPFHLDALSMAGFNLTFIAANPNSLNAKRIANEFSISKVLDSPDKILEQINQVDCLLIAPSSGVLFDYLRLLISTKIPILIEKPVFQTAQQIAIGKSFGNSASHIMVGYNRRYYESVLAFKSQMQSLSGGMISVIVPELSQLSNNPLPTHGVDNLVKTIILDNTVHMLDLVYFLMPSLDSEMHVTSFKKSVDLPYFRLASEGGSFNIEIEIFLGVPENYQIRYRGNGIVMELKPLEVFRKYRGLEIIEPTKGYPLRRYNPKLIDEIVAPSQSIKGDPLKPGFLKQALAFKNFVQTGQIGLGCSLQEAIRVSELSLTILDSFNDQLFNSNPRT